MSHTKDKVWHTNSQLQISPSVQRLYEQNFWSVSPSTLQIARDLSGIEIGLFLIESTKKFASN